MNTTSETRLWYVDNLRIFLISLVVLHHLLITYGGPGGWYYSESQADFPVIIPMSMFLATNQAFFMGMFFFISAFFILPSLHRKGTKSFINERLIRLGIPLLIFYFILSPFTNFIRDRYIFEDKVSFTDYLISFNGTGFGPLWFVEALLIFTVVFLLFRTIKIQTRIKFPKSWIIIVSSISIGLLQFLIRIKLPAGWSLPYTNFQLPYFVQYIFLFAFGIIAWQNKWLDSITYKMGKQWFIFAQVLIFLVFPAMAYLGGIENGVESFMGMGTWQSLGYAVWEQVLGFSLILGLFGIAKKYLKKQERKAQNLSAGAYAVFIIHAPVLLAITAIFSHWEIPQLLKFVVLAPISLIACFTIAILLKKIPGIQKIL